MVNLFIIEQSDVQGRPVGRDYSCQDHLRGQKKEREKKEKELTHEQTDAC